MEVYTKVLTHFSAELISNLNEECRLADYELVNEQPAPEFIGELEVRNAKIVFGFHDIFPMVKNIGIGVVYKAYLPRSKVHSTFFKQSKYLTALNAACLRQTVVKKGKYVISNDEKEIEVTKGIPIVPYMIFNDKVYRIDYNINELLPFYATKARAAKDISTAVRFDTTYNERKLDSYMKSCVTHESVEKERIIRN
jgi:hypothetical protein